MKMSAAARLRGCRVDEFIRKHVTRHVLDFASGAPLIPPPELLGIEAARAVGTGLQSYADSIGLLALREGVGTMLKRIGFEVNPKHEISITNGATGGLQAALFAVVERGDEVIVPVPGYEPVFDIIRLAGAQPVPIALTPPRWELNTDALCSAITPRTRAIYLNQPGNPTGRVFTPEEFETIIAICFDRGLFLIEDAVYDEIYYTQRPAVAGADARMRNRAIRVGSFSKTYAIPGWRLGFAAATGRLGQRVQRIAETMTGGAVGPLQKALVAASFGSVIDFESLRSNYRSLRDHLARILAAAGFQVVAPDGGIYIFAGLPHGICVSDLLRHGVAAMPGSLFSLNEDLGAPYARFCFARPVTHFQSLEFALSRAYSSETPSRAAKLEKRSVPA
jgi:aminotransferase